jgi:hypothetical protein
MRQRSTADELALRSFGGFKVPRSGSKIARPEVTLQLRILKRSNQLGPNAIASVTKPDPDVKAEPDPDVKAEPDPYLNPEP